MVCREEEGRIATGDCRAEGRADSASWCCGCDVVWEDAVDVLNLLSALGSLGCGLLMPLPLI